MGMRVPTICASVMTVGRPMRERNLVVDGSFGMVLNDSRVVMVWCTESFGICDGKKNAVGG